MTFDSKERCHKFFLDGMKMLGLGDGEKGWIEHDVEGSLQRDSLSFEGEIHFGFELIAEEMKANLIELANTQRQVIELQAELSALLHEKYAGGGI